MHIDAARALLYTVGTNVHLGSEVRRREHVDTAERLLMIPDITQTSTVDGVVTGFQIHTKNTKQVYISIWRHETGEDYK